MLRSERSTPLAGSRATSYYYPGFFGALFLVLLRIAIGWHFHNEGWEKVGPILKGEKGFSAEAYLRASTGPLAPYFRGLIPDVNGLDRLQADRVKAAWRADVDRIADHYGFNKTQRDDAAKALADAEQYADMWFGDREQAEKRLKYFRELREVQQIEQNKVPLPDGKTRAALSYERERAHDRRKELDRDRADLLKDIDARGAALREAVTKLADEKQVASAGPYTPPRTQLETMNLFISFSVLAIGFCLMAGLFTRLAALGGALFLLQIYLSMPPWPGLPSSPRAEGHYFIVDKNFVEMCACLALMALPTGQWVGLDALIFGKARHRRELELAAREERELADSGRRG